MAKLFWCRAVFQVVHSYWFPSLSLNWCLLSFHPAKLQLSCLNIRTQFLFVADKFSSYRHNDVSATYTSSSADNTSYHNTFCHSTSTLSVGFAHELTSALQWQRHYARQRCWHDLCLLSFWFFFRIFPIFKDVFSALLSLSLLVSIFSMLSRAIKLHFTKKIGELIQPHTDECIGINIYPFFAPSLNSWVHLLLPSFYYGTGKAPAKRR